MQPSLQPASDDESDDGLGDLEELSIRGGTPLRREPQDEADEEEDYYCDMCAETIAGTRYGLISAAAWLAAGRASVQTNKNNFLVNQINPKIFLLRKLFF